MRTATLDTNAASVMQRQDTFTILAGITDMIMVLDGTSLQILAVNHIFGRETTDLSKVVGKCCYKVLFGRKSSCQDCPVVTAMTSGVEERRTVILPFHGENRQFSVAASPLRPESKGDNRILVTMRDVTDEKALQARLLETEKMAAVGMLAAGVAHEINNPLTSISGFTASIGRRLQKLECLDDDMRRELEESVATITAECRRCQDIVRSLLTFSRPQFSCVSVLPLSMIVRDVVFISGGLLRQEKYQHVLVENILQSDPEPTVVGDEGHLKQVLLNLLVNALDAVVASQRRKPRIQIRTWLEGENAFLAVEDNGTGIEKKHLSKLFEPFFTTKGPGQGIGIGLSSCYSIVHAHQGDITVRSEAGRGACFTVRLPALTGGDVDG